MTRPSVLIIAGACGAIAIALATRHFQSTGEESLAGGARPFAAAGVEAGSEPGGPAGGQAGGQAGGWSARQGEAGGSNAAGGGPGGHGSAVGASAGATGGDGRGGSATTATTGGSRGGTVGWSGSSAGAAGGNVIRMPSASEAGARFENTRHRFGEGDSGDIGGPLGASGKSTDDEPDDENAPVLSLPLNGTVEPDKGEAPVVADGVSFESADGAHFATDAQFAVPNAGNMTGEAGSISFTLQPEWSGDDGTDASLVQLRSPNQWENRVQIFKNGKFLRFLFTDNTGVESGAGTVIENWQAGETHQVTATWGEGVNTLYVDGRVVGQGSYAGQFIPPSGPMFIGSDHSGGTPGARGTISGFTAYNRTLGQNEIPR